MITSPTVEDLDAIDVVPVTRDEWRERAAALQRWADNLDNNDSLTHVLLMQVQLALVRAWEESEGLAYECERQTGTVLVSTDAGSTPDGTG